MSKVKIEGNASGTGTLTISAPNTNTDRTLTLPDGAGEILTDSSSLSSSDTVTFQATNTSNQTGVTDLSPTKVAFQAEEWDSHGCYNTSTYEFTPTVAGYYLISTGIQAGHTDTTAFILPTLYKNGSWYKEGVGATGHTNLWASTNSTWLVYANGSTDYFSIYAYGRSGGGTYTIVQQSAGRGYFSAVLVKKA